MDIEKLYKIKESVIKLKQINSEQTIIINNYKNDWNDIEKLKMRVDELGKIVQTTTGNGTAFDPYKTWHSGVEVHSGEWWVTENGYLWEAIKDGIPSSDLDDEYWDLL